MLVSLLPTCARLLRLRTNLDQADDIKEHAWYEQASRADAIWSTAQVLKWGGWEKQGAIDTVELLATLPATTGPQHDAVQRAPQPVVGHEPADGAVARFVTNPLAMVSPRDRFMSKSPLG